MRHLAVLLIAAAMVLPTTEAQAGGRRRLFQRPTDDGQQAAMPHVRYSPYDDPRNLYPKYYGGFHARALQDIGIPTGDRGLRGNGIYMNPW